VQKAISYAMTSLFTTGGIRGNKRHIGAFHPRSFNMGIRREVFKKTGGYILPKKGEDIEFSIRIISEGFKTALIEEAFVYHKRRTDFRQFFKQLHFFGTARINVFRYYPSELKLIHFFPSLFTLGWIFSLLLMPFFTLTGILGISLYLLYFLLIFIDASLLSGSIALGVRSVFAAAIQLTAYGLGLLQEGFKYLMRG
jgi:GT2 family glycosyltransferase